MKELVLGDGGRRGVGTVDSSRVPRDPPVMLTGGGFEAKRGARPGSLVAVVGARAVAALLVGLLLWPAGAAGVERRSTSIDLCLGTSVNFRTPLTVRQDGQPDIELEAEYSTRALTTPLYYAIRYALERQGAGWEVEFVHHKLHLENLPEDIQHFEMTHGFNVFTVNRAFDAKAGTFRVGAGVVLAHPESKVRGLSDAGGGILDTGYILTGPALLLGAGKELPVSPRTYVALDVQLIAARARVPVAEGHAWAPSVGLHFLVGLGRRL